MGLCVSYIPTSFGGYQFSMAHWIHPTVATVDSAIAPIVARLESIAWPYSIGSAVLMAMGRPSAAEHMHIAISLKHGASAHVSRRPEDVVLLSSIKPSSTHVRTVQTAEQPRRCNCNLRSVGIKVETLPPASSPCSIVCRIWWWTCREHCELPVQAQG